MAIDVESILAWIPDKRWFGDKGRRIESARILDEVVVDERSPALVVALLSIDFADHASATYQLPLLVEDGGGTRDAADEPDRFCPLGELMAHGHALKGNTGAIEFTGPGLDPMSPPGSSASRLFGAEQSNTSVVLDDTYVVKFFRKLYPGPNPDLELARLLTNEGFEYIPAQVGEAVYRGEIDREDVSYDLAVAQQLVHNATEGWAATLRSLRDLFDAVDEADAREDVAFLTEERARASLDSLAELGEVTGALHVALSRDESNPDLAPVPVERDDVARWAAAARRSLELLASHGGAEALAPAIGDQIDALKTISDAGMKTRVHGDYHLGQVIKGLRWIILDFEGEPARTLEERRQKTSPIKDVAGMLRSFGYAASAALMERAEHGSDEWARLEPWADTWETLARDRFLAAYVRKSHEGRFLPADRESRALLLQFFELEKALYELEYETTHRPDWLPIPLRGIARIVGRSDTR